MQRLFFKIFLWFWLAMALVWSAFLIPTQVNQDQEIVQRFRALTGQRLRLSGWIALGIKRRGGIEAVRQMMADLEQEEAGAPYPFVFDERLQEVTGREAPPEAVQTAAAALEQEQVQLDFPDVGRYAARRIEDRHGERFAVVQQLPSRFDLPPRPVWPIALRWLTVLVTSGLVCYALARYLVAPVSRLSEATRRLAGGDLDVRVGQELAGRHDELADLGSDFDRMAARIGTLIEAQRQLLSDISHELRSPLARLYVALGLARKQADPVVEPLLDRIEHETERLNELIGELLALTRLEEAQPRPGAEPVDLAALVEQVVNDVDFEATDRGRRVRLLRADAGCRVAGFEELLRRAVENVVRNAARYTAAGTAVEVELVTEPAEARGGREAVVRVRDHGPGVAEEMLERLFQPFFRTAGARDRESGGVGLGLAITDRAVRLHGGRAIARNAPDGGLVVELRLPLAPAPDEIA